MQTITTTTVAAPTSPQNVASVTDGQSVVQTPPVAPVAPVVRHIVQLGRSAKADAIVAARLKAGGKRVCHQRKAGITAMRHAERREWTEWEKYGKRSYPRDRNGVTVHSCASVQSAGQVCVAELGTETRQFIAPRGYQWASDANGVKLVRQRDNADYHPTAAELFDGPAKAHLVVRQLADSLRANAKIRRANDRAAKRQARESARLSKMSARRAARLAKRDARLTALAERLGVFVCLRDSLTHGNCQAGSLAFAARHGLDAAAHYTPQQLLTLADGDRSRIAGAIAAALRRSKREVEAGYCLLSDHR